MMRSLSPRKCFPVLAVIVVSTLVIFLSEMFIFLEAASRLTTRTFQGQSAPSRTFFQRFSKTNHAFRNTAISTLFPFPRFPEAMSFPRLYAADFPFGNCCVSDCKVVKFNQYGVRRAGVSRSTKRS